jgi:hypothetical protein
MSAMVRRTKQQHDVLQVVTTDEHPHQQWVARQRELWIEVETLGSIRHKNMVNLHYCYFGTDSNLLAKFLDDARAPLHNSSEWTHVALREVQTLSI